MLINYSQKKVLIVDDFADFRRTVRGIVQQIGMADIDQAATAEEALKLCKDKQYDLILSDYNLGDGKDGQQLLEELKFLNLLKNTSVFLMITAETTSAMVMGALDYMPDGYLTKPFNKGMLQNRLEKILEKKECLAEIEIAMEKRQFDKAISLCQAQLAAKSPHALACLRLKAEALEAKGDLAAAAQVYQSVSASRPLPWALLGLGRIHFSQGHYAKAKLLFEEIIKQNPMFLNAYDWLAKSQAAEGDEKRAQQTLESAVKVSPKTIVRQMKLGEFARHNEDVDAAVRAYRNALRLGKNSCYNTPDNYVHFAASVQAKADRDGAANCKALAEDGVRFLQEASETYREQKDVLLRLESQKAGLFQTQGRPNEAQTAIAKAETLYPQVENKLSPDAMIDFAKALKVTGKTAKAQEMLKTLARKHSDHPGAMKLAGELLEDQAAMKQAEDAQHLNLKGVELFEAGDIRKALAAFLQARELSPDNAAINLNVAQAAYELHQQTQANPEVLPIGLDSLTRVGHIEPGDKRHGRYRELHRLYAELKAPSAS